MKLQKYVDVYFDGNKAAFGRAFGRLPQNITKLFNNSDQWMIVIGKSTHKLVQIRATKEI